VCVLSYESRKLLLRNCDVSLTIILGWTYFLWADFEGKKYFFGDRGRRGWETIFYIILYFCPYDRVSANLTKMRRSVRIKIDIL